MADINDGQAPQAPVQQTGAPATTGRFGEVQTTPLLNVQSGQIVNVPFNGAESLLQTGQYALPKNAPVPVTAPDGSTGTVPPEAIQDALGRGFKLQTTQEQRANNLEQNYGSGGQQALAGLAGAARGLTFGLSDQALTKTGIVNPDTLAGLKEANPISSVGGELGGILAPAIISGGSSLLAEGASAASIGISSVEAAGSVAENFVAKQAANLGLKAGVVKALSKTAGSAVEGAFYGGGNLISEQALGDADFNAESLASHVGMGALIGGTIGGSLNVLGQALQPGIDALSPLASKIKDSLITEPDKNMQAAKLLGMTASDYRKLSARNPGLIDGLSDFVKNDLKLGVFDNPESLLAKLEANQTKAGEQMDSVYGAIEGAVDQSPEIAANKADFYKDVLGKVQDLRNSIEKAPTAELNGDLSKVDKFITTLKKGAETDAPLNASALREIRQAQDDLLNYNKAPGQYTINDELGYISRTSLKNQIDQLAQRVEGANPANAGLANDLRMANKAYSASTTFSPFLEKAVTKDAFKSFSLSNPFKALDSIKQVALDTTAKLSVMGRLETSRALMEKAVNKTVDSMTAVGNVLQEKAPPIAAKLLTDNALTADYSQGKGKKAKNDNEAIANVQKNLAGMQDPAALTDKLVKNSQFVANAAPNTAGQLNATTLAATQFLASKVPRQAAQPDVLSVINPRPQNVSKVQAAQFNRYLNAVDNPKQVLKNIQNGHATHEEIEALRTVYPATFKSLQNKVIDNLQKHAPKMNYQQRIRVGMLLGMPTDQSLVPANILALQQSFAPQAAPDQGNSGSGVIKSTLGGAKELSQNKRAASPNQDLLRNGPGGEQS